MAIRILAVLGAVGALLLVATQPAQAQTAPPVPGDQVVVQTATKTISGILVDKVPDGYLVKVEGAATMLVPYAEVQSIRTANPTAATASQPVPGVVANAPMHVESDPPALLAGERWPLLFGVRYFPGATRTLETQAGDFDVDSRLLLAGDVDAPLARFLSFGADVTYENTKTDIGPGFYDTSTVLFTPSLRPHFRFGDIRLWLDGGVSYAFVETTYYFDGDPVPKRGRGHAFGPSYGAGIDWTIFPGEGLFHAVISTGVAMGAPVYSETYSKDFGFGKELRNVGPAVPPTRLWMGLAIGGESSK